jgi:hypothetical protein
VTAFDKYAWIGHVAGDQRLTVADRFVLTNAAIKYVRNGNDALRVRQVTIADQFAVGVRTVRQSISRARDLGYLTLAEPRQRGRSHHAPDAYRLLIPASCAAIPINSGTDLPEYRHETTEIAAQPNSLTSENADPNGFLNGFIDGTGAPASVDANVPAIPEEPPPRTCKQHAHWDGPSCVPCKSDRKAYEAWLDASRRLLAELDYQRDRATGTEAAAISNQRRSRITVFKRIGEEWK